MLQGLVSGAGTMASSAATWGTTWWRGTACAYPLVQEWIGWCPQPSICDYVPNSLTSLCQFVVENADYYVSPLADAYGLQAASVATIALSVAFTTWCIYKEKQTPALTGAVQEINQRLEDLQRQIASLHHRFDSLSPQEKKQEIDLVKRARRALEGYLKQAGVGDVFYGDRIREMGLELLEKRAKGEPLFSSSEKVIQTEEERLQRTLAAKEEQQAARRFEKSPAYSEHARAATSNEKPSLHQELMSEVKSKKSTKQRPE